MLSNILLSKLPSTATSVDLYAYSVCVLKDCFQVKLRHAFALASWPDLEHRQYIIMAPRAPPFRAEHLGSMLRPEELLKKRRDVDAGKAQASELTPLEDQAIKNLVELQKNCGFHALSDGEGMCSCGAKNLGLTSCSMTANPPP